jgi:hypothetical protein
MKKPAPKPVKPAPEPVAQWVAIPGACWKCGVSDLESDGVKVRCAYCGKAGA